MDDYELKFEQLKQHLPFLEKLIENTKRIKVKVNCPDPDIDKKIQMTQTLHKIITNRENKRLKFETLLQLERKVKIFIDQDKAERNSKNENRRDYNPLHNVDTFRPSSSCSNTSSNDRDRKKVFDDCPASPSPPRSPIPHARSDPIIIPTTRNIESPTNSWGRNDNSPPSSLNIIPITKINAIEQGPQEWDSDGEVDSAPKARPIVIPTGGPKKEIQAHKKEEPRWSSEYEIKRTHPSENIPTVQVNALEGSRRLSSVLEKTKVLDNDFFRNPSGALSPTSTPDIGMRSPDSDMYGRLTSTRTDTAGIPSLLLSAPTTSTRPPLTPDDLSELLGDQDRNNLRSREQPYGVKLPATVPKPVSRLGGVPDLLGPRPEKTISPLSDPRLSNDPRSRPSNDPRSNSAASRAHSSIIPNDPRGHGPMSVNDPRSMAGSVPVNDPRSMASSVPVNDPRSMAGSMPVNDPRSMAGPMPVNDPRSMAGSMPRYPTDNYNRPVAPEMIPSGPPVGYPQNPIDQQINYDYRMGSNPPVQQQWNAAPGHIPQPVPPPNNPYAMGPQGPNIRPSVPTHSGWTNSGDMQSHQPHVMNGQNINHSYTNQMPNMPRPSAPQSLMAASGYATPKYSSYNSDRTSYDMSYNQQQPNGDYRRQNWNRPFQSQPGEQRNYNQTYNNFGRPNGPPNSWNQQRDLARPNRDPRVQRSENQSQPTSENLPKDPPSDKDVNLNKQNKPAEKPQSSVKKRLEQMVLDIHKPNERRENDKNKLKEKTKEKDKSKEKEKSMEKDKSKEKEKSMEKDKSKEKTKSKEKLKEKDKIKDKRKDLGQGSLVAHRYGTIDAKAAKSSGLTKFKIPKKRPSADVNDCITPQEPSESISKEPDEEPVEETVHKNTDSKQSKGKTKPSKQKEKSKSSEIDLTLKDTLIETLSKELAIKGLDKDNISSTIAQVFQKLTKKKSKKGAVIYSSSEEDEDAEDSLESSNIKPKSKKSQKSTRIDSSPEESVDTEAEGEKDKLTKAKQKKKIISELKVSLGKLNVNELKKGPLNVSTSDKDKEATSTDTEKNVETIDEKIEDKNENLSESTNTLPEISAETIPAPKPRAKRRNRELETLQEDLKASWMCEGLMNTTNTRTCSQKNKIQDHDEEPKTGKGKKTPGPRAKAKAKKAVQETNTGMENSESEDDDPLAITKGKKAVNKKTKAKNTVKICPPPLFDDSSNDEFNLDASAVEPSSDISLHPESNDKLTKTKKKVGKKNVVDNEESSSDESYVSNTSSLLLDSSGKPRDSNEELLDDVMHQLAANPKYSRAKKKQVKKKKSGWQNGVVSKAKRKKKVTPPNKSSRASSFSNDDSASKDNDDGGGDKKNNSENLNEEYNKNHSKSSDDDFSVDIDALIAYTIPDGNPQTQCLICRAFRKNIVQHYKVNHPGKEVLISRLPLLESQLAIQESRDLDLENNTNPPDPDEQDNFNCRFCSFVTKGISKHAKESFYEHLTTHTGEYRFRCQTCGYECNSKNSIRSHYYKECKKHTPTKNVTEIVTEDPIPDQSRIYGYMCPKCHFLQLKRENVIKHVKSLHKSDFKEIKIVKIDMSLKIKSELHVKKESLDSVIKEEKVFASDSKKNIALKNDDKFEEAEVDSKEDVAAQINELEKIDSEIDVVLEAVQPKAEKKDNLSAFVCATEFEDNELEIQNERKKKMQEIITNIGIRTDAHKRISIIDQLKNKIIIPEDDGDNGPVEEMDVNISEQNVEESGDPLQIGAPENKDDDASSVLSAETIKLKEDPDTDKNNQPDEKIGQKLIDPLAYVDESAKPNEDEISDTENDSPLVAPVQYDSDSSNNSEHEEKTDVSSILQQSTENDQPSKQDSMFNTIQRLAAQIHNNKQPAIDTSSLPEPHPETIIADMPEVKIKTENLSPKRIDEDSTDLLSPSKVKKEVKNEPLSPSRINNEENDENESSSQSDKVQSPKKFIRLRRISGDKLSKGNDQESNENEQTPVPNATLDSNKDNVGFIKIASVVSLAKPGGEEQMVQILPKTNPEQFSPKSVSILKKPSYIIQRPDGGLCSVMTSPGSVISTTGETVKIFPFNLPNTSRSLIPKADNVISIAGQKAVSIKIDGKGIPLNMVSTTRSPINTTLSGSPKSPVKFIKLVPSDQMREALTAIKLKSATAYEKMLEDEKLVHMFKCMGRECCFTTNFEQSFQKHLKIHDDTKPGANIDGPKDYLKCAYCYVDCNNFEDLVAHLKNMHTFCRFCCKYCFYRGFAHSYVELHQKTHHPNRPNQIIVVREDLAHPKPPAKKLERKQVIKPYICEHNCKKYFFIPEAFTLHLNMHHTKLIEQKTLRCHCCKEISTNAEALIAHYKIHGYFKYHCLYCTYGAASLREMHNHLSVIHYNQPPDILERRLPQDISKDLSAIEQLKCRDIDFIYRQNKQSTDEDLTKSPSTLVPFKTLENTVANFRIISPRVMPTSEISILTKSAPENIFLTGQSPISKQSALNKRNDLSKSVNNQSNSKPMEDSDSDIEIIEEKSTISAPKNIELNEAQIKEETPEETLESQNSNVSDLSTQSNESSNSNKRFLTLEDIIHTGYSGHNLFRCGTVKCQFSASTREELTQHMKQCSSTAEETGTDSSTPVHCSHCTKKFQKMQFYMDHLMTHGLKRFKCGLCDSKFAVQSQAQTHLRQKHKFSGSIIVPVNPENPASEGMFIINPQTAADKIKSKKLLKSPEKVATPVEVEKTVFYPNEIEKLPLQSIFTQNYRCAVCNFANKVRSNMLRHLQAHLNDQTVPDSAPVNPVPCLDKKERMFDKMVNLASSSHENGRMGGGQKEKDKGAISEDDGLPKFVPESTRYVCGVPECNYLTIEESMLRHHMKVLHSEQMYYKCPHCVSVNDQDQAQNIPFDKLQNHFKMHDSRLFKCSYCVYYHYQRHVVERHLQDKHSDKPSIVKVIRDTQANQVSESPVIPDPQELEEEDQPDPDGNTWKCCLCAFKSVYKGAMQNHAQTVHGEKDQYQCYCGHKAISKAHFDKHLQLKHTNDKNLDYITVYKRIKPAIKKPEAAEPPIIQGEPFDTTPLWRRGGVRHIRGILVEEEEEEVATAKKRKIEADKSPKVKKEDAKPATKKIKVSADDSQNESDSFGSFGKPSKEMFSCPYCKSFQSKNKSDFKEHLYRELKYNKWLCPKCTYAGVNRRSVMLHARKNHANEEVEPVEGPTDAKVEKWVLEAIIHQSEILRGVKKAEDTDEDDLVIDTDGDVDEVHNESLSEPLPCKHCKEKFSKWRGFKRHVQIMHLRRLHFLCPYCDQSTNSEAKMMQHVRTKHPGKPEKVIENPNTGTDDLNDEFWEREYGLILPKRIKKRKKKDEDLLSKVEIEHPCDQCDFSGSNSEELKNHLKTHEIKVRLQCSYCTFNSFSSSEMRQHWEVNHPHREYMCEQAYVVPGAGEVTRQPAKKIKLEDDKKSTVYYCYYCNLSSVILETIRNHWKSTHKNEYNTIFKYKESSENLVKCAYCAEEGTKSSLANHISREHGKNKEILLVEKEEDGWLCKWSEENRCSNEFISCKEEMDNHQQKYHSIFAPNFKLTHRTFFCKECQIDLPSIDLALKHSKIHLNVYKCKHCDNLFKTFTLVKQHFTLSHPEFEAETTTITSEDLSKEMIKFLNDNAIYNELKLTPVIVAPPVFKSPPTSPRIAKKSTTKQTVSPRRSIPIKPFPQKIRAVARKSTNPLPRYPEGIVFEIEEPKEYVSYYKTNFNSCDLTKINIEMTVGNLKMKMNCSKLKEFGIDIDAIPRVIDCMKEENSLH